MSVRMRHTKGHTGNRRSHHALKATKTVVDKTSGTLRLPHRLDESTGMYRGKIIKEPKVKQAPAHKAHGTNTAPAHEHTHDHAHEHENAEVKAVEDTKTTKRAKAKSAPKAK